MSNPAKTLYNEIKQSIEEILDGVTEEEKKDILTALKKENTGEDVIDFIDMHFKNGHVMTFDIAHIMENL